MLKSLSKNNVTIIGSGMDSRDMLDLAQSQSQVRLKETCGSKFNNPHISHT